MLQFGNYRGLRCRWAGDERTASSPTRTDSGTDDGSESGSNGHPHKWTVEIRQANSYANSSSQQRSDPQRLVHRRVAVRRLALICALKCGNIKLAHPEHGLHGALGALRIGAAEQGAEHGRHDLPGHAIPVF